MDPWSCGLAAVHSGLGLTLERRRMLVVHVGKICDAELLRDVFAGEPNQVTRHFKELQLMSVNR